MIRAAVIGLGTISPLHIMTIQNIKDATLCAVCDIDENKKKQLPGIPFYTDYKELAEKEKPDVVHLCLPHYLHYPVAKYFVEKGINVFTEKPAALNLDQLDEFIELEDSYPDIKIGVCMQNRLNNSTKMLKCILDKGDYGKILGCYALVPWSRPLEYYETSPWRGKYEYAGGGVMINQAIHALDLLCYLCGDVTQVSGSISQLLHYDIEVEDTASARLQFEKGFTGVYYATNAHFRNESVQIEINTEKANFVIVNNALWRSMAGAPGIKLTEDDKFTGAKSYYGPSHGKAIRNFYNSIEDDTDDYFHIKDVRMASAVIDAITESSKEGKIIELSKEEVREKALC
ncbi:MAG: Gfo/Idh/MocA family oxidoreductase [Butyrivibrio sp.]|uniref:Gfo/Idh/MocA family protein n=1 Tax=Butyrivibrio sp. TaxID=28121 RepID=UPI0025D568E6|nr:Gfo/Idh/MocA family oxidoreductase [Butyrivibrio sp.]MCR5770389.1 Gfo/Idh/MocA family oxidoreductase [Butyrivibrio sp.]